MLGIKLRGPWNVTSKELADAVAIFQDQKKICCKIHVVKVRKVEQKFIKYQWNTLFLV